MKIIFSCPCGQLLATNSVISGFKVTCPKCQIRITVPFENKAVSEIIEIDYKDVLDPNGEHRAALTTYLGNNPKEYESTALNEQGGISDIDTISQREIP